MKKSLIIGYIIYLIFILSYFYFSIFSKFYFIKEIFCLRYFLDFIFLILIPLIISIIELKKEYNKLIRRWLYYILFILGIPSAVIFIVLIISFSVDKNFRMYIVTLKYVDNNNYIETIEVVGLHHRYKCVYSKNMVFLIQDKCEKYD